MNQPSASRKLLILRYTTYTHTKKERIITSYQGFNTLILSFLLASGPADQADAWTSLSDSQRASLKADYKANNITLLVSAFGSTESPTTHGNDPTDLAQDMAAWVKKWGMDGIDVDYEVTIFMFCWAIYTVINRYYF